MTLEAERAAHAVIRSWERLCKCTDEFMPDYAGACDEVEQDLYQSIINLRRALGYPDHWAALRAFLHDDEKHSAGDVPAQPMGGVEA